jgi:hypothetical protein
MYSRSTASAVVGVMESTLSNCEICTKLLHRFLQTANDQRTVHALAQAVGDEQCAQTGGIAIPGGRPESMITLRTLVLFK